MTFNRFFFAVILAATPLLWSGAAHAEMDCAGPDDPRTDVPKCESLQTPEPAKPAAPAPELSQEEIIEVGRKWAACADHGGCQIAPSWVDQGWLLEITPKDGKPSVAVVIDVYGTVLHRAYRYDE